MKKYDLIVVGGGLAGFASAISASRNGLNVLIVEKSSSLGGASTNGLVTPFMPNFTTINKKTVDFSYSIFKEIVNRLEKANALLYGSHFDNERLKLILNEMAQENNVDLLYHAYLCHVTKDKKSIKSITVATVEGEMELCASYFIDATGDAQLSYLSGCKTLLGRQSDNLCQPMTLCFRVGNIDTKRFFDSLPRVQEQYKQSLANGELINPRENILVFHTPVKNVLHFNTTRVVKKNPTSAMEKTEAEIIARKQVFELFDFLKKYADGMEEAFILLTAEEIGVRESRKIVGEYVLTEQDCLSLTKFEDGVVACCYEIDIHSPEGTGTSHHYFKDGEYYTIPYRSLLPKEIDNMLVAGRCISSDHGAQASYRIMPTVCSIGEVAGLAISMAYTDKSIPREINVTNLQKVLREKTYESKTNKL